MIESLLACFTLISFSSYGHLHQFLPKNLVGRLIPQNRVLGRITRFYNPGQYYWGKQIRGGKSGALYYPKYFRNQSLVGNISKMRKYYVLLPL